MFFYHYSIQLPLICWQPLAENIFAEVTRLRLFLLNTTFYLLGNAHSCNALCSVMHCNTRFFCAWQKMTIFVWWKSLRYFLLENRSGPSKNRRLLWNLLCFQWVEWYSFYWPHNPSKFVWLNVLIYPEIKITQKVIQKWKTFITNWVSDPVIWGGGRLKLKNVRMKKPP